jgi:aldehyde dehydrogenase (NAD+)
MADTFLSQQFINGKWQPGSGSRSIEVKNPFNDETVATFTVGSKKDIDDAYKAAAEAQKAWGALPYSARRPIFEKLYTWLDEHHEELVTYLTKEGGSTRLKSEFELSLVSDFARTAAALTTSPVGEILASPDPAKENFLYRKPVGVVGVISPFNAPFFLSLRPIMPALALGNAVVVKANQATPIMSGTMIARMFEECGLPAGLFNVIVTDIEEIGDSFVEHPIPEVISFTGSAPTGKHIAEVAGRHLKKAIMELGGNSALLVLEDADLDQAVNAAVFSRFTHSGQICMSANRVIVHESVHDEFVKRYVAKASSLPTGDPAEPSTIVGPLISRKQSELLESQIKEAVDNGAELALAAKPRAADSNVCTPVVMTNVTTDNPISQAEMFGPAVAIMKAKDDDDAIRLANATTYGLSGAVHSKDVARAVEVAKQIHSGMVHVNNGTIADEAAVPFGGVGTSGSGRLNGTANIEAFTRPMWISVQHGTAQFPY